MICACICLEVGGQSSVLLFIAVQGKIFGSRVKECKEATSTGILDLLFYSFRRKKPQKGNTHVGFSMFAFRLT